VSGRRHPRSGSWSLSRCCEQQSEDAAERHWRCTGPAPRATKRPQPTHERQRQGSSGLRRLRRVLKGEGNDERSPLADHPASRGPFVGRQRSHNTWCLPQGADTPSPLPCLGMHQAPLGASPVPAHPTALPHGGPEAGDAYHTASHTRAPCRSVASAIDGIHTRGEATRIVWWCIEWLLRHPHALHADCQIRIREAECCCQLAGGVPERRGVNIQQTPGY
jgi:hypothetical protein